MKIEQEQTELAEKNYVSKPQKKFCDKELSVFSVTSCSPRRSPAKAG
jgi:hypothetical protein